MKTRGLTPNDVTYNSLIDVCVRCNGMDQAWDLFTQMQENGIVPDNFTFSTLIKGIKPSKNSQKDKKDLDRAFSLLE
jgi:pentatricopeptide repeat domain-containing protein 1